MTLIPVPDDEQPELDREWRDADEKTPDLRPKRREKASER